MYACAVQDGAGLPGERAAPGWHCHDRGRESVHGRVAANLQSALRGPAGPGRRSASAEVGGRGSEHILCIKTTRCLRRDWTGPPRAPLSGAEHCSSDPHHSRRLGGWDNAGDPQRSPLTYQAIVARPLRVPPLPRSRSRSARSRRHAAAGIT